MGAKQRVKDKQTWERGPLTRWVNMFGMAKYHDKVSNLIATISHKLGGLIILDQFHIWYLIFWSALATAPTETTVVAKVAIKINKSSFSFSH